MGGLGRVGIPTWKVSRGQEALLEAWEGLGGLEGVRRLSRWADRGCKTLPVDLQGWDGPPGAMAGVGRCSQRAGNGLELYPEGWEGM